MARSAPTVEIKVKSGTRTHQNMKTTDCLLCGNIADLIHPAYTGYQEPRTFRIYNCPSCDTNFSMPREDASRLYDVIYSQREKHPGYSRYWEYAKEVRSVTSPLDYLAASEPTYFGVAAFLRRGRISGDARILEVGSGLGYLTYALRRSGYAASAIEVSRVAVAEAIRNFGDYYVNADLFDFARENRRSFDVVISTEVIEHVENPMDFIREMLDLLRHDGHLVLTTPNKSFFPRQMIWESSLPPIHCWWFSEQSLRYMASALGATVEFVGFREYFANKTMSWNKESCRNRPIPRAVLDADGNIRSDDKGLADGAEVPNVTASSKLAARKMIRRIIGEALSKRINSQVRYRSSHIFAGDKCQYICALFRKRVVTAG
jgi:2-polyprenyl-3-methyl-5-hydroxy-6-metoxy-1,4-benzoquinol methylase